MSAWSAHCRARRRCCAASAGSRCGGSPSLRCGAGIRPRSTRTARPASRVSRSLRARKSGSSVRCANLFQGHTSWQSSQPKMRLPISGAQFLGDRAFVLDRQVADAAPRVEAVRRDDRLRRADVDAARAGAAMRARRRVDRQRQVDVDLAEEEPAMPPSLSIRQVCLPIQPRPALRASARSSTGAESTNTRWPNGADLAGDAVGQRLQARAASACGSRGPARSARRRRARRRRACRQASSASPVP